MERDGAVLQRKMFGPAAATWRRVIRCAAPCVAAAALAACSSINEKVAGTMSEAPAVGLPASAPARPSGPPPFMAVHDIPQQRPGPTLTALEQKKLEDDLLAARNDQQKLAAQPPEPPKEEPKPADKPAKKVVKKEPKRAVKRSAPDSSPLPPPLEQSNLPVSSARSIY